VTEPSPDDIRLARVRENELVRTLLGELPGLLAFRCECTDPDCHELLVVGHEEIFSVRRAVTHLVLAPGHEAAGERVVARRDRFIVVDAEAA
jgi:hypothetical protein